MGKTVFVVTWHDRHSGDNVASVHESIEGARVGIAACQATYPRESFKPSTIFPGWPNLVEGVTSDHDDGPSGWICKHEVQP